MRKRSLILSAALLLTSLMAFSQAKMPEYAVRDASEFESLRGKQILYVERYQFAPDHHNTATMFLCGEINEASFRPGSAMRIYDVDTKQTRTLLETKDGVVRDPELSYDAQKIVFSMRKNSCDSYHIYEMNVDGTGLKQLTFALGVADIDPVYLPNGDIIFSSTRQPKYCMCNRHIMANLFRMTGDGANINQIGVSTLFEGHAAVMSDGRILYDRWEYVDRNFGDAQGLWSVNPDGTKHAIYYGNNTQSPGGMLDARQIPGSDLIVCTFSSCHDRPWGAIAVVDRRLGVDGAEPVVAIMPAETHSLIDNGNHDAFRLIAYMSEDPWPLSTTEFLVSSTTKPKDGHRDNETHSAIFVMNTQTGTRDYILGTETLSLFDPMVVEPREVPANLPITRDYTSTEGTFYVQDVYEGTHMEGVERGSAKYLRVVETPEKRTWTIDKWGGQGAQAPGINWHSFEVKRIIGEVEIEEDGSAHFTAPAGVFLYFQLLDKDKKMIQSMRSGVSLMPGEVNGCIGCHEDRLMVPIPGASLPTALHKPSKALTSWNGEESRNFSYIEQVQPILDRHCMECHDFDAEQPEKLVLAADKNMFFNASYINLYVRGALSLIGGGPADIQGAYSWGSHASKLTELIDGRHKKVKLSDEEKQTLYAWMDINGVYYPTYDSSFDENLAGRSPLTAEQMAELTELTGVNFVAISNSKRKVFAQIAFDRPELSPCLASIRGDKQKYDRAVEIIALGGEVLKELPRGDIESEIVVHPRLKAQLENYAEWLREDLANKEKLGRGEKYYDPR